jgi:SAM-dependent methyltransferase
MPRYDIRNILDHPRIYSIMQYLAMPGSSHDMFVNEYVRAKAGDRVLDFGCGPENILNALPNVDYVGIDSDPRYIESARLLFGARGTFYCHPAESELPATISDGQFDIVPAHGLIHHLPATGQFVNDCE